jgi:hypothetical protein
MLAPVDRARKQFEPCRNPNQFLYWRSRRDLPTGRWSRPFHRGTSPRQVLTKDIGGAGASWSLPANRLGPEDSVVQAVACGGARVVSLRSTPRAPPGATLLGPRRKRTGASLRCASLHHGPGLWPTAYKDVDEVRPPHAGSPRMSSSRPTASVPSCSEPSRTSLAVALRAILDRSCARRRCGCAGRDEETPARSNKETDGRENG